MSGEWLWTKTGLRNPSSRRRSSRRAPRGFRPDGRWIAFTSDESGRPEVFVAPFPSGPKRAVSNSGGGAPIWSRDGREIFYVGRDGRLFAVRVQPAGASLEVGTPQPLFALDPVPAGAFDPALYDVSADGRFLIVRSAGDSSADPVVVDVDWTARLKK